MNNDDDLDSYRKRDRANTRKIGAYTLGPELGEGAFATVRIATHVLTEEKVAVKVLDKLKLQEDPLDIERVHKEISILKKLHHKNIVKLYEIMESAKKIYLVMELCENKDLFEYIVMKNKISEPEALKFYQEIIDALDYMHSQHIAHRDLKPENLLLDSSFSIKLSDFGFSTPYTNDKLLKTACGTPSYAPPEMLKGEEYHGLLSDMWSSGVILYAMLCGYLPFSEEDEAANCHKIINGDYETPEDLSPLVVDLLKNILEVDPLVRYDVDQIKSHPWFNSQAPSLRPGLIIGYHQVPIDNNLIGLVESFGYNKEIVIKNLLRNMYDATTSIYYLSLRRLMREGYISISDLTSEEYVRYITDESHLVLSTPPKVNSVIDVKPLHESHQIIIQAECKDVSIPARTNEKQHEEQDNIISEHIQPCEKKKIQHKLATRRSMYCPSISEIHPHQKHKSLKENEQILEILKLFQRKTRLSVVKNQLEKELFLKYNNQKSFYFKSKESENFKKMLIEGIASFEIRTCRTMNCNFPNKDIPEEGNSKGSDDSDSDSESDSIDEDDNHSHDEQKELASEKPQKQEQITENITCETTVTINKKSSLITEPKRRKSSLPPKKSTILLENPPALEVKFYPKDPKMNSIACYPSRVSRLSKFLMSKPGISANSNWADTSVEKTPEESPIRNLSFSPKTLVLHQKRRIEMIPWKYKKMVIENPQEVGKYNEYKNKMKKMRALKLKRFVRIMSCPFQHSYPGTKLLNNEK